MSHDETQDTLIAVPDIAWALQERDSKGSDSSTKDGHLIPVTLRGHSDYGEGKPCLRESGGDCGGGSETLVTCPEPVVAFQPRIARNGRGQPEPIVPALSGAEAGATSDMRPCIASRTMVRRLTPVECERLQAHPDGYTAWGIDGKGRRVEQSDSARYRQLGNGVTANVITWLAKRIKNAHENLL